MASRWLRTTVLRLVVVLSGIAFTGQAAAGGEIHVPGDFETIQAALDAAEDGDEIVVAPGTYPESIDFIGKAVHLRSAEGPADTWITGSNRLVTIDSGEGPETILDGFTISNSVWSSSRAMLVSESSPTVTNCHFISNSSQSTSGQGGAVQIDGGDMIIIKDCLFYDNQSPRGGGAVAISDGGVKIVDCMFVNNRNYGGGFLSDGGGAVFGHLSSQVTIKRSIFFDNGSHPSRGLSGGAIQLRNGGTIESCMFAGNTAWLGGAVSLSADTVLADSQFFGNEADAGGAVAVSGTFGDPATITDCTFDGNEAESQGGAIHMQGDAVITGSEFMYNLAPHGGAAIIVAHFDSIAFDACAFTGNHATTTGGAIVVAFEAPSYEQHLAVSGSAFTANTTTGHGGVVSYIHDDWVGESEYDGNTFESNEAGGEGGVFFVEDGAEPPAIAGNVFCDNTPHAFSGEWINAGGNVISPYCPPGDLTGDGAVGGADLGHLLGHWGPCDDCNPPENCPADLTGDCHVGGADLGVLLSNWTTE